MNCLNKASEKENIILEEFKEQISRDIANLTRVIETINNLKSNEPSGTMRVSKKKNGFVQYYHRVWDTCTFRINGAPFPRQRCKRLAPAVRYPFVVTC